MCKRSSKCNQMMFLTLRSRSSILTLTFKTFFKKVRLSLFYKSSLFYALYKAVEVEGEKLVQKVFFLLLLCAFGAKPSAWSAWAKYSRIFLIEKNRYFYACAGEREAPFRLCSTSTTERHHAVDAPSHYGRCASLARARFLRDIFAAANAAAKVRSLLLFFCKEAKIYKCLGRRYVLRLLSSEAAGLQFDRYLWELGTSQKHDS